MGEPPPASPTGQDVTKSLRIVLNPADLGTVAVRMTMRGDTLRVHLRFETPEAAQVAAVERNKLSDALENTGLRLDHLVVDTVAQATRGAEASRPNTFSADTGASSGNSSGPRRDDTGARTPHRSDKSPSERPELAKETRDSGLYV
jgi:flagellar hook-length control protein FliK